MSKQHKPKRVKAQTETQYTRIVSPTQIIHVIKTIIIEPVCEVKG